MSGLPQRIEPYIALTTTSDQDLANRICGAIEDTGIPILLEHVEIIEMDALVSGYRLLTPAQYRESATRIVELHLNNYRTKSLVTIRPETIN